MKVVIIGGVAGGASAAARLRRLDESAEIIMLERGPYISYANCGLPYYVGGEINQKEALTLQTPQSFHQRFGIDVRTENEAVEIYPEKKAVLIRELATGKEYEESYDKLILSPGGEPARPPIPGIDGPNVFTLRTVPDSIRIREFIQQKRPRRAVIMGGGFIGLEMAENLMRAGVAVTVVEAMEHVMAALDYDMASEVQQYLRHQGVELVLSQKITAITPQGSGLLVHLENETKLEADLLLLSAGIRPESALAAKAGLSVNERGAIKTDSHMRTSNKDIYAVGDAVETTNLVTELPGYVPLAGPANKQGRIAADHISGLPTEYRGTQGSSVMKLFDMTVASTGLNETAAKAAGLVYDKIHIFSPSHATYYPGAANLTLKVLFELPTGRILGAQVIGFDGVDKRCDVLATAIRAGMTAYDLTELELCYAPPYSSAKDPVNMAGFAIENLLTKKVQQFHWDDIPRIVDDPNAILLDVRTNMEWNNGSIPGAVHIPLDSLRENLKEIDREKEIYVHCQSGLRSYLACRILSQNGFNCYNLSGGYRLYSLIRGNQTYENTPAHPCGLHI
ncbi:MAG: FAD-dependent oxidoreductase [Clostridium sp.]|uniref:FAD-dependent oxidoreductase n=1 Tax=Clostridium sp. TaxID=1506 RepID=UPI002913BBB3|nr:FAD-dependent oxidoreductase [Clostridium sp.]MDU7339099.1 FAD-dependent oxidoreductase [Clostridium sp.]